VQLIHLLLTSQAEQVDGYPVHVTHDPLTA